LGLLNFFDGKKFWSQFDLSCDFDADEEVGWWFGYF